MKKKQMEAVEYWDLRERFLYLVDSLNKTEERIQIEKGNLIEAEKARDIDKAREITLEIKQLMNYRCEFMDEIITNAVLIKEASKKYWMEKYLDNI